MAAVTDQPAPSAKNHHTASLAWWMAAGLVGADIGTSVFYSTGVLFPHVGFAAPFFILLVAISMWLFKTTYQEGCSVSPLNGGAYTMVLQTIGRRMALVVGSMTILSYLATAVVSALSGSLYLSAIWGGNWPSWLVALVAAIPVLGFAALNLIGLKESAKLVVAISTFHFAMLIVMDVWGIAMAVMHPEMAHWDRLLHGFTGLPPQAILLGFAAAFLGITGFESAAQIIEEIQQPTHESIRKIYTTIVLLVSFTSPVTSMLCLVLLSDAGSAAGAAWHTAARRIADTERLRLDTYRIGAAGADLVLDEAGTDWAEAHGTTADGAVLVRPDGFVAWRSDGAVADPEEELRDVLSRLLRSR